MKLPTLPLAAAPANSLLTRKNGVGLFECPGVISKVSDGNLMFQRKKHALGYAIVDWTDGTTSIQLLRASLYGKEEPAGWRLADDGESADLDEEYEFEDESDGNCDDNDDSDDECVSSDDDET